MTTSFKGVYKPTYPQAVVDSVRQLALQGHRYNDIANEVRRRHQLPKFNKCNVASMISRMRKRGEIELSKKCGTRPKYAKEDYRPASITLAPIPRRFT